MSFSKARRLEKTVTWTSVLKKDFISQNQGKEGGSFVFVCDLEDQEISNQFFELQSTA
jgi:hypothetical protein